MQLAGGGRTAGFERTKKRVPDRGRIDPSGFQHRRGIGIIEEREKQKLDTRLCLPPLMRELKASKQGRFQAAGKARARAGARRGGCVFILARSLDRGGAL